MFFDEEPFTAEDAEGRREKIILDIILSGPLCPLRRMIAA
jgi:hypothetical protein